MVNVCTPGSKDGDHWLAVFGGNGQSLDIQIGALTRLFEAPHSAEQS